MEKEHLIIPVHLSGEGTSYPSGAPKWRRNILSWIRCSFSTYVLLKDNMFLLHLGAPEG
jgi:hypothetical protein